MTSSHVVCRKNSINKILDTYYSCPPSLTKQFLSPRMAANAASSSILRYSSSIPSSFVRVLANIAENRSSFKAESWGFCFAHLVSILPKFAFLDDKYYVHISKLVRLMKTSIKLELTTCTRKRVCTMGQRI